MFISASVTIGLCLAAAHLETPLLRSCPETGTGTLHLVQGRDPTHNIREPVPASGQLLTVPDPEAALTPETVERRKARHANVGQARSGTVVVLHRGAWEYAPENTVAAIRAGFELGANGVELDFRRTLDGVIVLFHDDRLERMLDGVGS